MKVKTEQGSCITYLRWTSRTESVGKIMETSGVESHYSLGTGGRYHEPIRRVSNKIRDYYPHVDRNLLSRLVIKACNDTLGPEELVPALLVLGCIPRFPTVDSCIPSQTKRMRAMQEAKKERTTIVAQLRIRKAVISKVPRKADTVI